MLVGEVPGFARLEVDYPDQAVLHDQRYGQLGAHIRHRLDVALFFGDVFDQNRLPRLGRPTRDPVSYFDPRPLGVLPRIANLKTEAQLLGAFVEQKNGKDLVVDDLAHQFGNPAQGRVQVERSVDHVGHLQQQRLNLELEVRIGCDGIHREL